MTDGEDMIDDDGPCVKLGWPTKRALGLPSVPKFYQHDEAVVGSRRAQYIESVYQAINEAGDAAGTTAGAGADAGGAAGGGVRSIHVQTHTTLHVYKLSELTAPTCAHFGVMLCRVDWSARMEPTVGCPLRRRMEAETREERDHPG